MNIVWNGPIFNNTGYANVGRNTVRALHNLGVKVRITSGFGNYKVPKQFSVLRNLRNTKIQGKSIAVNHETPRRSSNPYHRSVKLTVFEFNRLPPQWANHCNSVIETWVPNQFNVDVFQASGVRTLHIIEHGVDSDLYHPSNPPLYKKSDTFKFLSVFEFSNRKGWDILIDAFTREFDPSEDVSLIIKSWYAGSKQHVISEFEKAKRSESPKLYYINKFLTDDELAGLYTSADCFVLPTKAEGWGLPFSEAMASGLPTIGTSWGGQMSFMDKRNSFLIGIQKFETVHDYGNCQITPEMKWAIPSVKHLRFLMRYVYEHPKEARKRAKQGRDDMVARFSWEKSARKIIRRCEQLQ